MSMSIFDYSQKSFAVIGETKPHKEALKKLGGRWNTSLKCGAGWIFSYKCREEVEKFITSLDPEAEPEIVEPTTAKPVVHSVDLSQFMREMMNMFDSRFDQLNARLDQLNARLDKMENIKVVPAAAPAAAAAAPQKAPTLADKKKPFTFPKPKKASVAVVNDFIASQIGEANASLIDQTIGAFAKSKIRTVVVEDD